MEPQQQYAQEYSVPVKVQSAEGAAVSPASPFNTGRVFLLTGLFMLGTLVMIPVWNSVALLQDATFTYMIGSTLPSLVIVACVTVTVLYVVTVSVFFRTSRPEVQTEQTILMIGSLFLALLGVLLLLLSTPLHRSADEGYHAIWNNCQFGPSRGLYDASQGLHTLRSNPACADLQSIEECPTYQPTAAALTLKAMEAVFRCSGFCYQPLVAGNTSAAAAEGDEGDEEEGSLLQTKKRRTRRVGQALKGVLAEADAQRSRRGRQAPTFVPYPPTLFSQANFQASCDGMAARNMRNFAGDVADQTFYEGVMLVIVSVIIGFLKLLGFCGPQREERRYQKQAPLNPPQAFGSVPSVRQRHVSRSELGLQ